MFSRGRRTLLSLPTRFGGLSITNPVLETDGQFTTSEKINEPLKEMIKDQAEVFRKKQESLRKHKNQRMESELAAEVKERRMQKQRVMDLLGGKAPSSWLMF